MSHDYFNDMFLLSTKLDLLAAQDMLLQQDKEQSQMNKTKKKKTRRVWVKPWLLRKPLYGHYENLMPDLILEDVSGYRNFMRLDPDTFQEILAKMGPKIQNENTFWRRAMEPGIKLAITLRYLATGNSYKSLQYGFRVVHSTISILVIEVCEAITKEYSAEVMACPFSADNRQEVAEGFNNRWNFATP
jgi:hypothetical protein